MYFDGLLIIPDINNIDRGIHAAFVPRLIGFVNRTLVARMPAIFYCIVKWNFSETVIMVFQEINAYENIVCNASAILFWSHLCSVITSFNRWIYILCGWHNTVQWSLKMGTTSVITNYLCFRMRTTNTWCRMTQNWNVNNTWSCTTVTRARSRRKVSRRSTNYGGNFDEAFSRRVNSNAHVIHTIQYYIY